MKSLSNRLPNSAVCSHLRRRLRLHVVSAVALSLACGQRGQPTSVSDRDVRPILAKHCFTCHGPDADAREADLRLDTQQGATADLGGYQAIKPGDVRASELITRVTSDDPDLPHAAG